MPPAIRSARVHVPVRPTDIARLDHIARQHDVSRAHVVREAIRRYLDEVTRDASVSRGPTA